MKPVRVQLMLFDGVRGPEVDAYPTPVPGLVVHRTFGQPDDLYTVTQQHTGVAAISYLPTPEHALGCAVELGEIADWTRPIDRATLRSHGNRIARKWGTQAPYGITARDAEARAAGAIL